MRRFDRMTRVTLRPPAGMDALDGKRSVMTDDVQAYLGGKKTRNKRHCDFIPTLDSKYIVKTGCSSYLNLVHYGFDSGWFSISVTNDHVILI